MPEDFPQTITSRTQEKFTLGESRVYAISITASCKRKNDLRVEIDNQYFREIPPKRNIQKFDIPPAWNGTKLKGRSQTNIFLLKLKEGEHAIDFIPKRQAKVEKFSYWQIEDPTHIKFNLDQQAKEGDKRPWFTFVLVNLPLKSVEGEVTVNWHYFDGDDIKLIIDNQVEKNPSSKLWRNWIWHATPGQLLSGPKKEQKVVNKDLPKGIHYIEFWADKTPTLHNVVLNLGNLEPDQSESTNTPTVDRPKWTGDFSDDTNQMILARALFGEARNTLVPDEARIAIGWVIRNRVASSRWPDTYWEVITILSHFSSFNMDDENRPYVEDPLHTGKEIDKKAWQHVYEIASKVVSGEFLDPTNGANHYYDDSIDTPNWAKDQKPTLTINYVNQYEKEARIFFLKL